MIIENLKSGRRITTSHVEWAVIVNSGLAYKYKKIEDDVPMEVKSLRKSLIESPIKTAKTKK